MYGSVEVIAEINLVNFITIAVIIFIILMICLMIVNIFLLRILRKKIDGLTLPIIKLSEYMEHIVENKNLDKEINSSNLKSIEVQKLFKSVEKMRVDVLKYIEIQKELGVKRSELYLAKQIQKIFMSDILDTSKIKELDTATYYNSAEDLSGDIYDLRVNEYGSVWVLIGDSMGKNSTASIFSLFLLAKFRVIIMQNKSPKQVMNMLNEYMCNYNENNMFISCVCIKIDFNDRKIYIANAGHDKPIIVLKNDSIANLEEGFIVLGIDSDASYEQDMISISDCKSILLYRDGLSESKSSSGFYGVGRIESRLISSSNISAAEQLNSLLEDICSLEDSTQSQDDKTAILIKFIDANIF